MGCQSSSVAHQPRFRTTSKPCKSGYLLITDGKSKWKKVFVILFQDSTLAWFKKPKQRQPISYIRLNNVCNMMLVGPVIKRTPGCPKSIPKKTSYSYIIAFPQWMTIQMTGPPTVGIPLYYLMCPNGPAMGLWMNAIAGVLPPPLNGAANVANGNPGIAPSAAPMYAPTNQPYNPPQRTVQQQQAYNTSSNHRSGRGDLTKGFLVGAALGYGFGRPWAMVGAGDGVIIRAMDGATIIMTWMLMLTLMSK